MASLSELRDRTSAFLERPSPPRDAARGFGTRAMVEEPPPFSLFVPAQLKEAIDLSAQLMELANAADEESGLERVLDTVEEAARERDLELIKYALMVFVTHHPRGRQLPIPPLERRAPTAILPSQPMMGVEGGLMAGARAAFGAEAALDWFREDTWLNDHHSKWHIVYPGEGHPNPQNPQQRILRNRQGELFSYMHQQMLARYDTERAALGLPLARPLSDYAAPIAEGYAANLPGFSHRPANAPWRDLTFQNGATYRVQDHAQRRDRLMGAATSGMLMRGGASVRIADISVLGATAESTIGSADGPGWLDPLSFYGSHHNFGHVLLANLTDPSGPHSNRPGVMTSTATAMRDPAFYRWHRHVDDVFFAWQERHLPPYDFADAPPGVLLRKALAGWPAGDSPDVLLCRQRDVPGANTQGFDGRVFGQTTFGGQAWDLPRASFPMLAPALETQMRTQALQMPDGRVVNKPYVDHDDFFYFFRVENQAAQPRPITVRVFLAAADHADNRRLWIEMDKFGLTLPATQRIVIFRPSRLSSVVRKPAWRPTEPRPVLTPGTPEAMRNYCDCGWPYHLLLPRGRREGMAFRLMVMMTDWTIDRVGADSACGSLSFCGARDTDYPDTRAMGYPFDRPPVGGLSVTQMLAHPSLRHVAATTVTIRLV
jgi:tyrosinase